MTNDTDLRQKIAEYLTRLSQAFVVLVERLMSPHLLRYTFVFAALLAVGIFTGTEDASVSLAANPLSGCTSFYGYDGQTALAANNEDFINPLMYAWYIPATDDRYGRVYFGFDDFIPQGGLNDQGLFFDGQSLPYKANSSDRLPPFPGGDLSLVDEILSRSATVQEVVDIVEKWDSLGSEYGQNLYGDRFGDSVIIDGDAILRKQGAFQIATNFRLSEHPAPPWPDGEDRYGLVADLLLRAENYTVDLFRRALDIAHSDGPSPTLYSQVYELNTGIIHLYLYHDFEHEVVINLQEELAKGPHVVELRTLFPESNDMDLWAIQQIYNWRASYRDAVDPSVPISSLVAMNGQYEVLQQPDSGPVSIFMENEKFFMQRPYQLPIELYPSGPDQVFHRFLNGFDLTFSFERNLLGEVSGAHGTFSYEPYNISIPYDLVRPGVVSRAAILWILGVIIIVVGTVVMFRNRNLR